METIDYSYFLMYKRLAKRFKLSTIDRHWTKAQAALLNRQDNQLKAAWKEIDNRD